MAEFKPITEQLYKRAVRRAERDTRPYAVHATFDRGSHKVTVELNSGISFSFDPRAANGLEQATEDELSSVQVEGAGGGLRFPKIDADFSIARLLEHFLGPLEWARKEARAAASRANGKLGGRPRREPAEAAQ